MTRQVLLIGGMIAIITLMTYFTTIRPQKKTLSTHKDILDSLTKGDEIMTAGGFIAKVEKVEEKNVIVLLEPDNIKARVSKQAIVTNITKEKSL